MSRFHGRQYRGAARAMRKLKRAEAEARTAATSPTRRRQYRLTVAHLEAL